MMRRSLSLAALQLLLTWPVDASISNPTPDLHRNDDLQYFVTRPELRPPKWNITIHDEDKITDGYWMISNYGKNRRWHEGMECEIGPMIFDNNGELIWSGACLFNNHDAWDWTEMEAGPGPHEGETWLRGVILAMPGHNAAATGLFLGPDYSIQQEFQYSATQDRLDPHEFNALGTGWTDRTLTSTVNPTSVDAASLGYPGKKVWTVGASAREVSSKTGRIMWEWFAEDHVPLNESMFHMNTKGRPQPFKVDRVFDPQRPASSGIDIFGFGNGNDWDAYHLNAVDKNSDGNYLISLRHTNAIYLVSGKTKEIIWRLGGTNSSFKHTNNFKFSRQHNCRFVEHNANRTVISFLDNSASGIDDFGDWFTGHSSETSRGLIVELIHEPKKPMTATILHQYDCPDGCLAYKRGNVQLLDNKNVFIGWTIDGGHLSEHLPDGTPVLEAKFYTERYDTYRMYKLQNFVGRPKQAPDAEAITRGVDGDEYTGATTIYASWHGATEQKAWAYYVDGNYIGTKNRTGFETVFTTLDASAQTGVITVDALDKDGNVMDTSRKFRSKLQDEYVPHQRPQEGEATEPTSDAAVNHDMGLDPAVNPNGGAHGVSTANQTTTEVPEPGETPLDGLVDDNLVDQVIDDTVEAPPPPPEEENPVGEATTQEQRPEDTVPEATTQEQRPEEKIEPVEGEQEVSQQSSLSADADSKVWYHGMGLGFILAAAVFGALLGLNALRKRRQSWVSKRGYSHVPMEEA